jgi:hypothetical protein
MRQIFFAGQSYLIFLPAGQLGWTHLNSEMHVSFQYAVTLVAIKCFNKNKNALIERGAFKTAKDFKTVFYGGKFNEKNKYFLGIFL